jgi:hypothetical protein
MGTFTFKDVPFGGSALNRTLVGNKPFTLEGVAATNCADGVYALPYYGSLEGKQAYLPFDEEAHFSVVFGAQD